MARYKRIKAEPEYRVKIAYNEITNRLNGLGIRWDGSLDLDDHGFGHAWIKTYRFDKKAQFIYICSHNDNMDPNYCEPIYRFIKVYNYTDDTMDDYVPGDIPFFASSYLEFSESDTVETFLAKLEANYKSWQDNEYVYAAKYGILWQFIKDPVNDNYCIPFTNYPMNVESLDPETSVKATDDWRCWPICEVHADDVIFRRADTETDSGYSYISSALSAVVTNDDTMYIGTSFNSVEDIYLPFNDDGSVYAVSGNIDTYYYDDTNFDDYRICPKCLGTNKNFENGVEIPCKYQNANCSYLDIKGVHYVTYSDNKTNRERPPKYENSRMFVLGKTSGSKTELLMRPVRSYKESAQTTSSEYVTEYPFWLKKLNNEGKFEIHYNLYACDKLNSDSNDIKSLLYQGVTTCVIPSKYVTTVGPTTTVETTTNGNVTTTVTTTTSNGETTTEKTERETYTAHVTIGTSVVNITFVLPWLEEVSLVSLADSSKYTLPLNNIKIESDFTYSSNTEIGKIWPYAIIKNKHVPYETKDDRSDIINKYTQILPYLILARRGWYYGSDSQVLNYTTHNKSKTFDFPWNYDDIMNFIQYKDENLKIFNTAKGLTYSHSHTFQDDYSQMKNLDNIKIWYADIDNDDLLDKKYVLNFDRNVDFPLQDNMDDFNARTNIYNYNPGYKPYYAPGNRSELCLRSLPSYEGIYQYKKDEYDELPIAYAWIKTESAYNSTDKTNFMYYTGDVDTYELHEDYINQFFQFRNTKPIHSVYYKEEFSACDEISAGSGIFLAVPATSTAAAIFSIRNSDSNPGAAVYGGDCNLPYTLPGLKDEHLRYRHICSACSGMGVLGINLQSANPPYRTFNRIDKRYINSEHPYRCPVCRGCGTRMRYVYLDHKLITSGHNPVSMTDDDKEQEILYETLDKKPIEYWYNATGVDSFDSWKVQERWEDYVYESIELSGFKEDSLGRKIPSISGSIDTTKCYRWYNDIDDCVSYSAYDHAFGWQRIYFDKAWIKGQWNATKKWENVNQMYGQSWSVDDADHLHHSHLNTVYFKEIPINQNSTADWDYKNYNYRHPSDLNTVCPQCDGKKKVINYIFKPDGSPSLDVMGEQRTEEITCPLCTGKGIITRTHAEGYNTVICTHCNNTGKVQCPVCKGTKVLADGKPCDACCYDCDTKQFVDNPTGYVQCSHCGGMLKVQEKYIMIGPDRDAGKKIYKLNSRKAISSDNVMIEMARISYGDITYAPGYGAGLPDPTTQEEDIYGITKENGDPITKEDKSVILREHDNIEFDNMLITEQEEQLQTEAGEDLVTEDYVPAPSTTELKTENDEYLKTEDYEDLTTE